MKIWWSQLNQSNCNHELHVKWYNLSLLFLMMSAIAKCYSNLNLFCSSFFMKNWANEIGKLIPENWILICCCRTDYLRLPPYNQKVWIAVHYLIIKACLQYPIIIDPHRQPHWNSLCACFNHHLFPSEFIFFCDKTKNKNKLNQSKTSWPLWCRQKDSLHCYLVV